jgi:hypothetical protein
VKKLISIFALTTSPLLFANTLYVDAGKGSDQSESASIESPLRTIRAALSKAQEGDIILLLPGTYRESVIINKNNLTIKAHSAGVFIDGTEKIELKEVSGAKYKQAILDLPNQVEQVFSSDKSLSLWEARWPNIAPEKTWVEDRNFAKGWLSVSKGTGVIDGTKAAINYVGGKPDLKDGEELAVVYNLFSQFRTKFKKVNLQNTADGFRLVYDLDSRCELPSAEISPCAQKNNALWWSDDYFYLLGSEKLLDAPGEWFFDQKTKTLKVIPLSATSEVFVKVRPHAFTIQSAENINFEGLNFFATAIKTDDAKGALQSSNITVKESVFQYPSWDRYLRDNDNGNPLFKSNDPNTDGLWFKADGVVFANNLVEKGGTYGLYIDGTNALVKNNLFRDIDWFGNLEHAPIIVTNNKNLDQKADSQILNNTVYNFGNVGIRFFGAGVEVGYNNVFNGGLLSLDTAMIYTARPTGQGSRIHHNFVHDGTGIGIRLDGFSVTGMTVDHNVIWNVNRGLKISGFNNAVVNNTIDVDNSVYALLLEWGPEQRGLERPGNQNRSTEIVNNLAYRIHFRDRGSEGSKKVTVGELYNFGEENNPLKRLKACEGEKK